MKRTYYAFRYTQPVYVLQQRRDMVVFTRSTRKTSSSIDDRLYSLKVTIRQTRQCDITIVKSTLDRMNAVISVANDERGSERRMQRVCLKMPNQEQTSWMMCESIDISVSIYTPRSRTELTVYTL